MTTEQKVQKQYTEYTYPKYNKEWDKNPKRGPEQITLFTLRMINHYGYQGKQSFNNFRVLVAGCGLGTDLIHLAIYLANYNGEVVGIDLSPSALAVVKERLAFYNIKNVTLHQKSLLDVDPKTMGLFDHINCVGVLHHLKDPVAGLTKLSSVLKEDGTIAMMVYAQYGRVGVYRMQELLKKVNKDVPDYETKIKNYKKIYSQLPTTHLLKQFERVITDHKVNDNGIVDELLHCQDRAYTIPQLYEYVQGCKLTLICHLDQSTRQKLTNPIPTIDYKNMTQIEKEEINELYHGDIIKHIVLLSKIKQKIPTIDNQEYIPVFNFMHKEQINTVIKGTNTNITRIINWQIQHKIRTHRNNETFVYNVHSYERIHLNAILHKPLLQFLGYIDEKRSIQQISELLQTEHHSSKEEVTRALNWLDQLFIQKDIILLKHPSSDLN